MFNPFTLAVPVEAGSVQGFAVLERSIYTGPHLFGALPMIRIKLDLGDLATVRSHQIPGFVSALLDILPGLADHGCGCRNKGGLAARLSQGTLLGHVVEHVALELQVLAGSIVTRGKTRAVKDRPGVFNVLYAYHDAEAGLAAGAFAIRLVQDLLPINGGEIAGLEQLRKTSEGPGDLPSMVDHLRGILRENSLGPSTQALVLAARKMGIPVQRLDPHSLIQLGHGAFQKRFRASVTGNTSLIGATLAANKAETKRLLHDMGLPVPQGQIVSTADAAAQASRTLGFPVVVKPLKGNHGRGVSTGVMSEASVRKAFEMAALHGRAVIVESQLPGKDHRLLVVGGKLVAAAERVPARVIGDGTRNISALIAAVNADPRRGDGHANTLTRIAVDREIRLQLARLKLTLESVPVAGQVVRLRGTANLSTGGTAIDRTAEVHPENRAIAETAADVLGLDVAGIDFLSPDISKPVRRTGGGIVEVNAAPGLRMHLAPDQGRPRAVAVPIIRNLFPRGAQSRIPIFAITGTNGKSTVARMLTSILTRHGQRVGLTTTHGIEINGHRIAQGDCSGPRSARTVLRHPHADCAVLETARGGILREGLGFDQCDVGAVLNVSGDHLGLKGVETLEALAAVKSVIVRSVARNGHSILNYDDPLTRRMARRANGQIIWFSMQGAALPAPLARHVANGGTAVVCELSSFGGLVTVYQDGERTVLMPASAIPATVDGRAAFNIENALASAAMALAHRVPLPIIREALTTFRSGFDDNPGRLNVYDRHPFRVVMDYAHNPAALGAIGEFVREMRSEHRRVIGMVSIPGDRRDVDILEMGRLAAHIFDQIVFREGADTRGRPKGSVNALMAQGAIAAGLEAARVEQISEESGAVARCLEMAKPGDLVVILLSDPEAVWQQVVQYRPSVAQHPRQKAAQETRHART
jgi:cyanophycin synthetase